MVDNLSRLALALENLLDNLRSFTHSCDILNVCGLVGCESISPGKVNLVCGQQTMGVLVRGVI